MTSKTKTPKAKSALTYPTKTAKGDEPRPGSREFNEAQTAATGHPGVPDHYTNEGVAANTDQALAVTPGLNVISDEWYGRLETGNPFQEAGKPFADANPDKHFRFLGKAMLKERGQRGYQVFNDPATGKPVEVSGMQLAFIPMGIKEEKDRRLADKNATMRRQSREEYEEATRKLGADSEGKLLALGKVTETQNHRRVVI